MQSKLIIPKTINVGFQERKDTYTGKLAYVVYTDDKGVLRKAASWNGWRTESIEPLAYENVPTSGFVLNKKVGDYRGHWDGRKAWIRVYDPRGFEMEISVANLVFILEECSSIKGKGLEGDFVYAWDRSDMVLLPVSSKDYTESTGYTALQTKKVSARDVVPGCIYTLKDTSKVMYLGRENWHEIHSDWDDTQHYVTEPKTRKLHVFVYVEKKERWNQYLTQTGFTRLAERLTDEPSPLFAGAYEEFKASTNGSPYVGFAEEAATAPPDSSRYYSCHYVRDGGDGGLYLAHINVWGREKKVYVSPVIIDGTKKTMTENMYGASHYGWINRGMKTTEDEISKLNVVRLFLVTESGKRVEV